MKIGIPKEIRANETRVALIPSAVPQLLKDGHEVLIEAGAGAQAYFPDALYLQAGARILPDVAVLYKQSEAIFKVQPPLRQTKYQQQEAEMFREGSLYLGLLSPLTNLEIIEEDEGEEPKEEEES